MTAQCTSLWIHGSGLMSKTDLFPYKDREKAFITVSTLEEPYGEGSKPVVSVGCTLKGDTDNPTWKVHIPIDLLESVSLALYQRSPSVLARMSLEDADHRHKVKLYRERMDSELRAVQKMIDNRHECEE